jgi:hypothetical protein
MYFCNIFTSFTNLLCSIFGCDCYHTISDENAFSFLNLYTDNHDFHSTLESFSSIDRFITHHHEKNLFMFINDHHLSKQSLYLLTII